MDGDSHRSQVVTTLMSGAATTTNYTTHGTRQHYTQIQTVGQAAISRSFDLDGRLTAHGTRSYVYDAVDNLVEAKESGATIATYGFDALGRRITKTAGGWQYRYIHAGPWLIEDYRRLSGGSGIWQLKGSYVHGSGIDNVVMMRHRDWVDEDSDLDRVETKNFFFHGNRLGSVTELTAEDGSVVERYRYEEYGTPTILDPNGVVLAAPVSGNPFLFTGRDCAVVRPRRSLGSTGREATFPSGDSWTARTASTPTSSAWCGSTSQLVPRVIRGMTAPCQGRGPS